MLAIAYRPAWADSVQAAPDRDEEKIAALPANGRKLFGNPIDHSFGLDVGNKPANIRGAPQS